MQYLSVSDPRTVALNHFLWNSAWEIYSRLDGKGSRLSKKKHGLRLTSLACANLVCTKFGNVYQFRFRFWYTFSLTIMHLPCVSVCQFFKLFTAFFEIHVFFLKRTSMICLVHMTLHSPQTTLFRSFSWYTCWYTLYTWPRS